MGVTPAQPPPPVSCASVPARHLACDPVWTIERRKPRALVSMKHVVESAGGLSTLASVVETTLAPAVGQPSIRRTSIPVREVGGPKGPVASPS
jgi:hypothetical protein